MCSKNRISTSSLVSQITLLKCNINKNLRSLRKNIRIIVQVVFGHSTTPRDGIE